MTITRNGVQFELTAEEMRLAFQEQLHQYDMENVLTYYEAVYLDTHEPTPAQDAALRSSISAIADDFREIEDFSRTQDWWDSAATAIDKFFSKHS